jgi:hypothetical protein
MLATSPKQRRGGVGRGADEVVMARDDGCGAGADDVLAEISAGAEERA